MSFSTLPPNATLKLQPFEAKFSDSDLEDLKASIRSSRIAPETFEGAQQDRRFGVTRDWILETKEYWLNKFDWRATEQRINSFENYKTDVEGQEVHFVALLSKKTDAIPLLLLHGWPGSFLEFLPILSLLKDKYTPETLPYNVIIPSLPGFGFSARPPLDREFGIQETAKVFDSLMVGLGYGEDYAAQGGDLGSFISRVMAQEYDGCKAVHQNFYPLPAPKGFDRSTLDEHERHGVERGEKFNSEGHAYADEHATRPSTIGIALSSSPIALLSWVGEKFLAWTDQDLPIDTVLEDITLYWLTDTISTSFYHYRSSRNSKRNYQIRKPYGYSSFPEEIMGAPKAWLEGVTDLAFYRQHDKGGHFAALEQPEVLLQDIEDFLAQVWGKDGRGKL